MQTTTEKKSETNGPRTTSAKRNAAIERFVAASHDAKDGPYLMGVELAKMRVEGLWKPHRSFEQFLAEELKFSKAYAYRLISVVENFTLDEWRTYGADALKLIAAAPKELHEPLLDKARDGATTRQLEHEIRTMNLLRELRAFDAPALEAAVAAAAESMRLRQNARATVEAALNARGI